MTEGFLQNHIKSTLQSLRIAYGNPPPFTREAEMRLLVNVNFISHTVGRWLAAAEQINENKIDFGCYQNWILYWTVGTSPCGCPTKAPSDEGAVVFRRKMTEGEITKIWFLLLSLPQFRYAQQLPRQREPENADKFTIPPPHVRSAPPFTQGRLKMRLSVDLI